MGIKDELKRMTGAIFGGAEEDDQGTEQPSTDAPGTEQPGTEMPTTEIPAGEFNTEAPATSTPTTELPNEIAELRAELELLKANKEKGPEPTRSPSTDAPIEDQNFLDGMDLDDLTRDPDAFNTLLNKVFKKGIETARGELKSNSTKVLSSVPSMVNDNLNIIQSLEKASNDFYAENTDLKEFKQVVSTVFGEVATANPDKSYIDTLSLTGDEVRKRLKLTKVVKSDVKPPKLPKAKGQRRAAPTSETKGVASEIDAMNKAL